MIGAYLSDTSGLPDEEEVEVAHVVLYTRPRHKGHRGHVDPEVALHIHAHWEFADLHPEPDNDNSGYFI
jgi:hypothetical protein